MGLPDGWLDYDRVGKQVEGTRFIAFKVPLREGVNVGSRVPEEHQLHPKLLVSLIPKLGLIIDLTNTTKYYNPDEFNRLGVAYQKIYVEGHVIPSYKCSTQFRDTVDTFLENNSDNDKLIGVHCTHGLNRSGFLVCRYMIEEMKMAPLEAIAAFEKARGHKMERENYLEKLKKLNSSGDSRREPRGEVLPSLAIDTESDKGTQTNHGFWIDEYSIPLQHRSARAASSDRPDETQRQVSLMGCVNIQRRDLIPDGHGGYFVHITKKEIQRNDPNANGRGNRYDDRASRYPPNGHIPRQPYSNAPYPTAPYSNAPYPQRSRQRPNDNHMYSYHNSLPSASNNLAEDLLRMQHPPRHGRRF